MLTESGETKVYESWGVVEIQHKYREIAECLGPEWTLKHEHAAQKGGRKAQLVAPDGQVFQLLYKWIHFQQAFKEFISRHKLEISSPFGQSQVRIDRPGEEIAHHLATVIWKRVCSKKEEHSSKYAEVIQNAERLAYRLGGESDAGVSKAGGFQFEEGSGRVFSQNSIHSYVTWNFNLSIPESLQLVELILGFRREKERRQRDLQL